jgi:hypothetical protein
MTSKPQRSVLDRGLETGVVTTQNFQESTITIVAKVSPYLCWIVLFQMTDCMINPVEDCVKSEGNAYKEHYQQGMWK